MRGSIFLALVSICPSPEGRGFAESPRFNRRQPKNRRTQCMQISPLENCLGAFFALCRDCDRFACADIHHASEFQRHEWGRPPARGPRPGHRREPLWDDLERRSKQYRHGVQNDPSRNADHALQTFAPNLVARMAMVPQPPLYKPLTETFTEPPPPVEPLAMEQCSGLRPAGI